MTYFLASLVGWNLCDLHVVDGVTPRTQLLREQCLDDRLAEVRLYWFTAAVMFVVAVALHLRRSILVLAGLLAFALGPFVVSLLV